MTFSRKSAPCSWSCRKRFLGVQGIRLDQHPFQIQLAEELPQHGPLMVFVGGVAGLVIATPKAAEYSVT